MASLPLAIAHAGGAGSAPENTLAAVRAALAQGVDGIEVDVHASADGVPVLIHDPTLDRTTDGHGPVAALPFSELHRLDAGARGFDGRFRREPLPSLAEAADLIGRGCLLVAEIKPPGIAPLVVEVLRRTNAVPSAMVWSFDRATVTAIRTIEPRLPAALLASPPAGAAEALLEDAVQRHLCGLALQTSTVDAALVRAARLRGLCVYAWTADDPDEQRRLAACGVDGIVSNVPDVLQATLRGQ